MATGREPITKALAPLLVVVGAAGVSAENQGAAQRSKEAANPGMAREEFARAIAKIKEGMAAKEILALLGKPDDVRTKHDPGGISTTRTKEIWCYGTNGHLT